MAGADGKGIRQGWKQLILVQPLAGLLLRSLWTGPCPWWGRGGAGAFLGWGHSRAPGSCWDPCRPGTASAPLSMSKEHERHGLGLQTSLLGTFVRDTKQSTSSPHLPLLHTRAHTRSLTLTHTLLTSEMMTVPLHTLRLVVLGFLLPLFLSRCPADHTHPLFQKTPNNSFHKLFLKERNKTEHKRGREEENQPTNQPTNKKRPKSLHEKQALRRKILAAK